ncbi:hypothetical protein DFJ73DRAFT_160069 [Zopfochytrium polystomum]|nr:hypothetical protein DFJ73DRAFT_160069 [Zopfochytrium polystomum]
MLSCDVFPSSGERFFAQLIDALEGNSCCLPDSCFTGSEPWTPISSAELTLLGRRPVPPDALAERFKGVEAPQSWEENKELIPSLHMLVIACSSMHSTLIEEQLRGHDLSRTVVVPFVTGVTQRRVMSMLKTKLVLFPCLNFEDVSPMKKPNHMVWDQDNIPLGYALPDLDSFRSILTRFAEIRKPKDMSFDEVKRLYHSSIRS